MTPGRLDNQSTGAVVGECIQYAHTSLTRMLGLLGCVDLPAGEGIWIKPSSGIHTLGMRIPIDVLALDRDLRVIRMWHHLRPWRIPRPSLRIASVVELAAGQIACRGVHIGDRLQFVSLQCASPAGGT
jgi:uncharacterized membrane protein (UPF0127 family)